MAEFCIAPHFHSAAEEIWLQWANTPAATPEEERGERGPAWFSPKGDLREPWEEHLIEDFLLDPHSLQLGDLCGNGRLDLLVGEIGVKDQYTEKPPRLMVYENDGQGHFTRHVIDEGTGTHHARLVDLRGTGLLDIASRPLHGPEKWNIIVWYNNRGR